MRIRAQNGNVYVVDAFSLERIPIDLTRNMYHPAVQISFGITRAEVWRSTVEDPEAAKAATTACLEQAFDACKSSHTVSLDFQQL